VQKSTWFEASAHIPFLMSWPARLSRGVKNNELVSLTDLFAIASSAAGSVDVRDGMDVLAMLDGVSAPRENLFGIHGLPGTHMFKFMVRSGPYKYNFYSNGGLRQLFNLEEDPHELHNIASDHSKIVTEMHASALAYARRPGLLSALEGDDFKAFPRTALPLNKRMYQMAEDLGVKDFSFLP